MLSDNWLEWRICPCTALAGPPSVFDSPGAASQFYATFLRPSLGIRLEAARGMGNQVVAERIEERLRALGK